VLNPTLNLASGKTLKALMAAHGIRPQHRLGQNFLIDESVLAQIADATNAGPDDLVLEIGPGLGSLTQPLAARAGRVVAIELDQNLVKILGQTLQPFYPNLEIIHGNAASIDLHEVLASRLAPGQRAKAAANLPYYITTPLVLRLIETGLPLESLVVMVQLEVADRMISPPGSKEYGALSVAVQYYTEPRIVRKVSRGAFLPPPDVDSAVVAMKMRQEPPVDAPRDLFFRVVKAAFGQRRKTLANALMAGLSMDRDTVTQVLARAEIDPTRRGETLSLEEFARVARNINAVE